MGEWYSRIIEACQKQGVEEPTWRWDGAFIYVTFKRPSYNPFQQEDMSQGNFGGNVVPKVGYVAQNVATDTGDVVQDVASGKEDDALSIDERIIQIIRSNPSIRREDIALQLSVNKKTVERHLKDLCIRWKRQSKSGHWLFRQEDITQDDLKDYDAQRIDGIARNVAQDIDDDAQNIVQNSVDVAKSVASNQGDVALPIGERMLEIIKSNLSIKREDLAEQLSVSKKTVERHLKRMGVRWEGHPKSGHWVL